MSVPAAGQLVTVYMLVVTVGGPVATVITRRLPRRGLLVATMALATGCAVASALAGSYGVLLVARLGSALAQAQALFMAVASPMAMAGVPPHRQTAAVARVFGGFALATVIGLPLGVLALVLLAQGTLLRHQPLALAGLVLLGGAAFVVVPLVQTWLMGRVGPQAAGLVAAVNISVAGAAGALGAGLGGAVLAVGLGLGWIGPVASVPVWAATEVACGLRRQRTIEPAGAR